MKTVFITLFVIFFQICCTVNAEKIITTDSGYKIYSPDQSELLKDVSPFCLGSVSDTSLLFDYGLFLADKSKALGADACVIGSVNILDENFFLSKRFFEETIAPFFSISPYKSAQIVMYISNGLLAGGIFPALSAGYDINDAFIDNLKNRGVYPIILTEDIEYDKLRLINLNLPVIDTLRKTIYHETMLKKINWNWHSKIKSDDELRREILLNAIVRLKNLTLFEEYELFYKMINKELINKTAVFVSDPRIIDLSKFKTGYLIHSDDEFVLERIRLICKGIYIARGTKNW